MPSFKLTVFRLMYSTLTAVSPASVAKLVTISACTSKSIEMKQTLARKLKVNTRSEIVRSCSILSDIEIIVQLVTIGEAQHGIVVLAVVSKDEYSIFFENLEK